MTIREDTPSVAAVWFSLTGGRFRVEKTSDDGPGQWSGRVLDDDGNSIGSAGSYPYGTRGASIHTRPFAGFVPIDQIDFV